MRGKWWKYSGSRSGSDSGPMFCWTQCLVISNGFEVTTARTATEHFNWEMKK
jgi:hypothetical protein